MLWLGDRAAVQIPEAKQPGRPRARLCPRHAASELRPADSSRPHHPDAYPSVVLLRRLSAGLACGHVTFQRSLSFSRGLLCRECIGDIPMLGGRTPRAGESGGGRRVLHGHPRHLHARSSAPVSAMREVRSRGRAPRPWRSRVAASVRTQQCAALSAGHERDRFTTTGEAAPLADPGVCAGLTAGALEGSLATLTVSWPHCCCRSVR
jgi:hypothetical protein